MTQRLAIAIVLVATPLVVAAQNQPAGNQPAAKTTRTLEQEREELQKAGFIVTVDAYATGTELLKQENLFVMEVSFKPLRMVWVEIVDAKTGKKKRQLVWYLVYRAVNRPLPRKTDDKNVVPRNYEDARPPQKLVPVFTLVTDDNGEQRVYRDQVIAEAEKIIRGKEERGGIKLKNTVEVVQPVPPSVPEGKHDEANVVYGLVMWKDVFPKTDFFTIQMRGFSNAYKVATLDGQPIVVRKAITQSYWRPGDEFDQNDREIRRKGDASWIELPDKQQPTSAQPKPAAANGKAGN